MGFSDIRGQKVLLLGDAGVGKTRLTAALLDEAVTLGFAGDLTVIDIAPTDQGSSGSRPIGAPLAAYSKKLHYVRVLRPTEIRPPRLLGKTAGEVLHLARRNAMAIRPVFAEFRTRPSPILFLNDVTLYLQAGSLRQVLELLRLTQTAVVNGYHGRALEADHGSGLSARERRAVESLAARMDRVIELPLQEVN